MFSKICKLFVFSILFLNTALAGDIVHTTNAIVFSKTKLGAHSDWKGYVNPNFRDKKNDQWDTRRVVNFFAGTGAIGNFHTGENSTFITLPYRNTLWTPNASMQTDAVGINHNGDGFTRMFFPQNPKNSSQMGESFALIKENKGFGLYLNGSAANNTYYLPSQYDLYFFQKTWDDKGGNNNQDVSISLDLENQLRLQPFYGSQAKLRYQVKNLKMQTGELGGSKGHCRLNMSINLKCVNSRCSANRPPSINLRAVTLGGDESKEGWVAQAHQKPSQTPYNIHAVDNGEVRHDNTGPVVALSLGDASIVDDSDVPSDFRHINLEISFAHFKTMLREVAKVQVEMDASAPASVKGGTDDQKAAYWWGSSWSAKNIWYVSGISARMELTQHDKQGRTRCGGSFEEIRVDKL